ncbi:hypothetical protein [Paenibacillus sp. Y412MC10]|nr:hypothetical protein [Paenibacillus sp. Y412MC10]
MEYRVEKVGKLGGIRRGSVGYYDEMGILKRGRMKWWGYGI